MSYISRNHARQTGTNRTTQAEISNAFWLGFPGRVKTEKLQLSLAEKSGAGQMNRGFAFWRRRSNWPLHAPDRSHSEGRSWIDGLLFTENT